MDLSVQKTAENIWAIEQRGVRAFLLVGTDSAVLVDTCFGGDIGSVCEAITDMPITLLTTTPAVIRSFLCSIFTAQNSQDTKGAARDLLELV